MKQSPILRAWPLFIVGLTLRPLTSAIGPVLPEIRAEFGLTATAASLLSTLPVIMFGLGAFLVPRLLNRVTPNHAISYAMLLLALGAHLRMISNIALLYIGTVIIGLAVAIGNVTPSVIARRDFPKNVGGVLGLVTGAISFSACFAALLTYPLTEKFNSWRPAIELWAVLPLIAWLGWRSYSRGHKDNEVLTSPRNLKKLMKTPLAWALVFYFGLQSTNFYALGSWLPTILRDAGTDATTAGNQLSLLLLFGFPTGLFIPPLAAKFRSQVWMNLAFVTIFVLGLSGIYSYVNFNFWPEGTWLWVILLGIGLGSSFPLALTLVLLRTDNPTDARDLGSFMQGFGYFISATGPLVFGIIKDVTSSWNIALLSLGFAALIQLVTGHLVSRPGLIVNSK